MCELGLSEFRRGTSPGLGGTRARDLARSFAETTFRCGGSAPQILRSLNAAQDDALPRVRWGRLQRIATLLVCLAMLAFSVAAQPQNPHSQVDSLYRQGLEAVKRGDLVHARTAFEQVVKLAPASPEGHNSLGWVLFSQGQTGEAISQIRIALRLKPNFLPARINLANALAQSGNLVEAESEAREAVRLAPGDSEGHRTLGRVISFRGDMKGARSELKRAVELEPKRADLRDELGSVLAQSSDLDEAAVEFSEALRLQPDFPQAALHLGVVRWRQKRTDEALSLLQKAAQLAPQSVQAHYYL